MNSMICATLQLGDSEILVCDANNGELLDANVLYYIDDGSDERHDQKLCHTRTHGFGDEAELARFNRRLNPFGISCGRCIRTDVMKGEIRFTGEVIGSDTRFNECARAVETMNMYTPDFTNKGLHNLQREPEFVVWQLPERISLAIIVCCDGFVSKMAFPNTPSIARCICDPESYTKGSAFLEGTIFQRCDDEVSKAQTLIRAQITDAILLNKQP